MTLLLGWISTAQGRAGCDDVRIVPCGEVSKILAKSLPEELRNRLALQQRCYTAFDTFLPHRADTPEPSSEAILTRIERIFGYGQLRVRFGHQPLAEASPPRSGKEYLRNLRQHRCHAQTWSETVQRVTSCLSRDLSAREKRTAARQDAILCDFLVARTAEERLADQMRTSLARHAVSAGLDAEVTVSGLWVPFSFACGREEACG